jgi:DNA-binding GntR family transcriptional regulator
MKSSDIAYQRLREEIVGWTLPPGTPLAEVELSERLGVSRTPVREALSRLTAEGLVVGTQGRTAIVAPITHDDVRRLYELREALETEAVRMAARRRDPDVFAALREAMRAGPPSSEEGGGDGDRGVTYLADLLDAAVSEAMDNRYIADALRQISGHVTRLRRHARVNPARLAQAQEEHLLIVDAIIAGDDVLARQAMAIHLHKALENLLETLPELPEAG